MGWRLRQILIRCIHNEKSATQNCSCAAGGGSNGSCAWGQTRIATVDLRKLFDGYWKTKQADAVLKDRAADVEKELKTMLEDLKKAKEEYQNLFTDANNTTFSLDEREKRKKSAEDKFKQIKESEDTISQYDRRARTTLDEQAKRMRASLVRISAPSSRARRPPPAMPW